MTPDWMFAKPIGLYVVADVDGNRVRSVEMTAEKPDFKPHGTPFIRALEEYFRTGRDDFSAFAPDLSGMPPFRTKVMKALRDIPAGSTVTYGELADMAGSPGAARAVGNVMARNPVPLLVPCHRVVATGGLGGFASGIEVKLALLQLEKAR